MNYERHCWRLLVLGLIFGFILGVSVAGVEQIHLDYADSIINDFEAKQRARVRLLSILKGVTRNGRCI